MKTFIEKTDELETSREILEALLWLSNGNENKAMSFWENGLEDHEFIAVWERVTKNGNLPSSDFCWGSNGSSWAKVMET